ncbi:hypothetical protein SELR_pSRC102350 (plasmid) [Selenomonas ruminantium subsp. lactilytica TAM6421]|uniref:Uncharacterized protein n=1 Tax=Selenomonas ruminantium subsp. lactilytica (strain NBRC 103574 / TAM6421) TaxID=927704 RepID=I0GWA5_SELRL|nr:tetratricopeptide repeat protein [Selenomonas ruminantium]BAL85042.1 hypothetical protein SELR_pSRC102350 [Selenomonas ruminantium subsp. lactilytica TAM6421]
MTKEKYNELVQLVQDKSKLTPPLLTYNNYDNWEHKATLARLLNMYGLNYPKYAIELFRDAIAIPLNEKSSDRSSDIDLRAWALRDLSILESQQGDNEQALQHIEQAIDLAESRTDDYEFTIRGNLLMHKFLILCELGQAQEAEALADDMIERYKNAGSKNNSYVFYGNQCKAKLAAKRGKHAEVKEFMLKALDALDNTNEAVAASRTALLSINTAGASAMDLFKEMQQALPDAYHEIVYWDTNCFQDKR